VTRLALIGIAGATGALLRYGMQNGVTHIVGRPTVLGTLLINVSGAFLLGLVLALTDEQMIIPNYWRPVLATGFLGAYTTFSTLMFESFNRFEGGDFTTAAANIVASVALGLLATYIGLTVGRAV
jgi:CrcB protein